MGMKLKKNQDSSFIEICTVLRMAWAKKKIPSHPAMVLFRNLINYIFNSGSFFITALKIPHISTTVTNNARLFNF